MMAENGFNKLERAVLEWYKEHYQNKELSAQIDAAKFVRREWTKVGFYVAFEVPRSLDAVDMNKVGGNWPVDGPHIESPQIDIGALCLLWGKEGYMNCIEMVAYGENFAENVEDFELRYVKVMKTVPGLFPWIAEFFRRLFGKKSE